MQIMRGPKVYDVCIVGSGAGGGMAAEVSFRGLEHLGVKYEGE
jgi:hypothetical protein